MATKKAQSPIIVPMLLASVPLPVALDLNTAPVG